MINEKFVSEALLRMKSKCEKVHIDECFQMMYIPSTSLFQVLVVNDSLDPLHKKNIVHMANGYNGMNLELCTTPKKYGDAPIPLQMRVYCDRDQSLKVTDIYFESISDMTKAIYGTKEEILKNPFFRRFP